MILNFPRQSVKYLLILKFFIFWHESFQLPLKSISSCLLPSQCKGRPQAWSHQCSLSRWAGGLPRALLGAWASSGADDCCCRSLPGFLEARCQKQLRASAGTFPRLRDGEGLPQCVPNLLFVEAAQSWLYNSQFSVSSLPPVVWHLTRENASVSQCLPL